MSNQKKSKIEKILPVVNTILNDRLCLYSQTDNKRLLLRHASCPSNQIAIMPIYSSVFVGITSFVSLVENYGLCCYVTAAKTEDGSNTAMLVIYDPQEK